MVTITCPNCHTEYDVEDSVIGAKVECAECHADFIANGSDVSQTANAVNVQEQRKTMSITCPNCGNACDADGELQIGEQLLCPYCSHEFVYSSAAQEELVPSCRIQSVENIQDCFTTKCSEDECEVDQSHPNDETLDDTTGSNRIAKLFLRHKRKIAVILLIFGVAIFVGAGLVSVAHIIGAKCKSDVCRDVSSGAATNGSFETSAEELRMHNAEILYRQGIRHYTGNGALKDKIRAFKCFSEASEQGYLPSDSRLAWCYWSGEGCEKDMARSFTHASKAEKCKDIEEAQRSQMILGLLYFDEFTAPGETQSSHNFRIAYEYFSKITEFPYAIYVKGLMEYHGAGTPKNASKAAETFYELASSNLCNAHIKGKAEMCLGMLYYNGEGVSKDYKEAWKWLWKGARDAYPALVKAAKAPLTEDDVNEFLEFTDGRRSIFTPYTLKMYRLYQGEGVLKSRSSSSYITFDLLESALRTMFTPALWKMTGVEYTRENM